MLCWVGRIEVVEGLVGFNGAAIRRKLLVWGAEERLLVMNDADLGGDFLDGGFRIGVWLCLS